MLENPECDSLTTRSFGIKTQYFGDKRLKSVVGRAFKGQGVLHEEYALLRPVPWTGVLVGTPQGHNREHFTAIS